MSPNLHRLLPRASVKEELNDARKGLWTSIRGGADERRKEPRVAIPEELTAYGRRKKEVLVDFSSLGLAVQVQDSCYFARGERHRLTLSQGPSSIDVEGVVRWTYSTWKKPPKSVEGRYHQVAGFAIDLPESPRAKQEWEFLTESIQAQPQDLDVRCAKVLQSCSSAETQESVSTPSLDPESPPS